MTLSSDRVLTFLWQKDRPFGGWRAKILSGEQDSVFAGSGQVLKRCLAAPG